MVLKNKRESTREHWEEERASKTKDCQGRKELGTLERSGKHLGTDEVEGAQSQTGRDLVGRGKEPRHDFKCKGKFKREMGML